MLKNQRRKFFNIFSLFREYWHAPGYCLLYESVSCLIKFTQISTLLPLQSRVSALRLHNWLLVHQ